MLGIIKTMGSITEPPEILGKLIGGALVGTFLGILIAYGFVAPLASAIKGAQEANSKYIVCLKAVSWPCSRICARCLGRVCP